MNLSIEKKQTHGLGEQACGCQERGAGRGMGWPGSLGLVYTNYCMWSV